MRDTRLLPAVRYDTREHTLIDTARRTRALVKVVEQETAYVSQNYTFVPAGYRPARSYKALVIVFVFILLGGWGLYTVVSSTLSHSTAVSPTTMAVGGPVSIAQAQNTPPTASTTPTTPTTTVAVPVIKKQQVSSAVTRIQRIAQTSPSLYLSQADHDTWAPSTCSTASMTEVFDAYGAKKTFRSVLATEISVNAISADAGLLDPQGIDRTAAALGFATQTLNNPPLSTLYQYTDKGEPVIVSFPPQTWAGGHILVVKGHVTQGSSNYVMLVDSSNLNMQAMLESKFLSYWRGFAKVVTPNSAPKKVVAQASSNGQHSILGVPTMTASAIDSILCAAGSPACGKGQVIYDDGVAVNINPAYALAFYHHESSYGLAGVARYSNSIGNLRCIPTADCVGGYAYFSSWEEGIQAYYTLLHVLYVQDWHLTTVEQIIPKYAPTADNNDEAAYEAAVIADVNTWR